MCYANRRNRPRIDYIATGNARQPIASLCTLVLRAPPVKLGWTGWNAVARSSGYTARLSAAADARATAVVSADRTSPAVRPVCAACPCAWCITSGRFDLWSRIAAETTAELDQTLGKIGGVKSSENDPSEHQTRPTRLIVVKECLKTEQVLISPPALDAKRYEQRKGAPHDGSNSPR
jgi:hypothetical protein